MKKDFTKEKKINFYYYECINSSNEEEIYKREKLSYITTNNIIIYTL